MDNNFVTRAVGSPVYLDEMLKHTMENRFQSNYSSFEAFQQLINDVYESDQRENMVDLFQRYINGRLVVLCCLLYSSVF